MYYYITIDNILVESSREVNNASYLPITEETYYQLQAEFAKKALEDKKILQSRYNNYLQFLEELKK